MLSKIKERIYKLNPDVKLVAVSKNVDESEVLSLYNEAQSDFGENRVQELKRKMSVLPNLNINWHFIGRLQTNKINQLIELNPLLIHSIDSLSLAKALDKRLELKAKKQDILLQINSAKEQSKAGVMPELANETYEEIKQACKNLNLIGVMSIGAYSDDMKLVQKSFEATYKIYESLSQKDAKICSMGMSNDFELAIKCGSNLIRLGSILYGK